MPNQDAQKTEAQRLADLVDSLLAGEGRLPDDQIHAQPGLPEALQTIHRLRRVLPSEKLDPGFRNRTRARLAAEWNRSHTGLPSGSRPWRSSRQSQRTLVLRFTLLAAAILTLVLVAFPSGNIDLLPGTAGTGGWRLALVIIGIFFVLLAIWLIIKRKRR